MIHILVSSIIISITIRIMILCRPVCTVGPSSNLLDERLAGRCSPPDVCPTPRIATVWYHHPPGATSGEGLLFDCRSHLKCRYIWNMLSTCRHHINISRFCSGSCTSCKPAAPQIQQYGSRCDQSVSEPTPNRFHCADDSMWKTWRQRV